MEWTAKGLDNVKVGDLVAPIIVVDHRGAVSQRWGKMLHRVTQVGPKRFRVTGDWVEKTTGRKVGRNYNSTGHTLWVIATPEMLKEVEDEREARNRKEAATEAFNARPEVQSGRQIQFMDLTTLIQCMTLEEMQTVLERFEKLRKERGDKDPEV